MATSSAPEITKESVAKCVEGLSDADKISQLVDRLVKCEEEKKNYRGKAQDFDKVNKLAQQFEKKLEKNNQVLLKTEESKSKLEELCRQLQKYNKEIREESLIRAKKLESERQEAVVQLRNSLQDIEKNMNEGRDRSDVLAADNTRLAEKLSELGKQYEERLLSITEAYKKKEEYWGDLNKARECEIELLKTKLQAATLQTQKSTMEKEELTRSLLEGTQRVGEAISNEAALREQVKQYADRYTDLAKSLGQSNQAFDKFKKEIDRVNTQLKKVESESIKWKVKYDEASKNILLMTAQKLEIEERATEYQKKVNKLESLCRALSQRNSGAVPSSENTDDVE